MVAGLALVFLAGGPPDFSEVAEKVADSIVSVRVRRARRFAPGPMQAGVGSGAVIDARGHIVTAQHVVSGARTVTVVFRSGREKRAVVTGTDPRADLAILKVDPDAALSPIELGDSDGVKVGQWAIALGAPFGLENSFTVGVASSVRREFSPAVGAWTPSGASRGAYYGLLIQTDAALNPGNSGGPLVDSAGRMIGVNVIIYVASAGGTRGVGFAVPVNELKRRLRALKAGEPVRYPYLGVAVDEFGGVIARAFGVNGGGALIDELKRGSPAEAAGLRPGEIIRAVSGEKVDTPGMFISRLWASQPGEEVELELVSAGGSVRTVRVKLGEKAFGGRPSPAPREPTLPFWRGLKLSESESGPRIASVVPGSPAAEAGLQPGLIIEEAVASGRRVTPAGPEDFERFVSGVSGPVAVRVRKLGYFVIEGD